MLDLVFQNLTSDKKYNSKFFGRILDLAIKELKLKDHIEMSVNLVGEPEITRLNLRYRNKNKPTDVLSFPIESKPLKQVSILPLGDIFICLSFAKKEAKSENISIDKKLAQLTVHGFLHLLGYDHELSKQKEKQMFSIEGKILNKLN